MKSFLSGFALLFLLGCSFNEILFGEDIALSNDEAAALAENNTPAVQAAIASREATIASARVVKAPGLPQISGHLDYGRQNAATLSGDYWRGEATAEQFLYGYGRWDSIERAVTALRSSGDAALIIAKRDARYMARVAAEGVRRGHAQLMLADAVLAQRTSQLDDSINLRDAGQITDLDVRVAKVVVANAQDGHDQASAALAKARIDLGLAIGRQGTTPDAAGALARPADVMELLKRAEKSADSGPDLASIDAERALTQARAEDRRSHQLPELFATSGYGRYGSMVPTLDETWHVALSLRWTLFDGGQSAAERDQALATVRSLTMQRQRLADERHVSASKLRVDAETFAGRITRQEQTVAAAFANYNDSRELYRAGRITQTRLREVELAALQARFDLISLIYDEAALAHAARRLGE